MSSGQTLPLFDDAPQASREQLGTHAWLLRGFALSRADVLLTAIARITAQSPFRQMSTPGGLTMSVGLSNCGALGWTSDSHGYRYTPRDPLTDLPWPSMPAPLLSLAAEAAEAAGFPEFMPDACLLNRYLPGSRLSLHQDRNERDFSAPIVSVSLGMGAIFLFGGHARSDRTTRVSLLHGDVAVWGGEDRLRYHGILPLKDQPHPATGSLRYNLTFRKAG
ncbi:DNA oxidative demethylase AlkB [Azoarcus indigens]|uniref:DNA alkylation damage repair protein AlkB n=1 Tax=Azoarcus indigens TaxID=29545 RepID=A0A4R6DLC3_9RHOO|nr:DNA oxidative demethylase AlkB [Azoarcus indigens]NMG66419.1 DNA oxidative demethylase AlkB [Azoarcus indigens]TDN45049.1 DNA alkylation damage repair protein AlkB [Azoarcus indigens]